MLTRNHPRLSLYMFMFFIGSLSEQAMVDYDIYTLIPLRALDNLLLLKVSFGNIEK